MSVDFFIILLDLLQKKKKKQPGLRVQILQFSWEKKPLNQFITHTDNWPLCNTQWNDVTHQHWAKIHCSRIHQLFFLCSQRTHTHACTHIHEHTISSLSKCCHIGFSTGSKALLWHYITLSSSRLSLNTQQSASHTQAFANHWAGLITEPVYQDETIFFFCLKFWKDGIISSQQTADQHVICDHYENAVGDLLKAVDCKQTSCSSAQLSVCWC